MTWIAQALLLKLCVHFLFEHFSIQAPVRKPNIKPSCSGIFEFIKCLFRNYACAKVKINPVVWGIFMAEKSFLFPQNWTMTYNTEQAKKATKITITY